MERLITQARPKPLAEKENTNVIRVAMKRTPQPALTQSRLTGTGMLKIQGNGRLPTGEQRSPPRDRSFSEGDSLTSTETVTSPGRPQDMDTSTPELSRKRPRQADGEEGMREFFLQALKMNKEEIIKSFQTNLGEVKRKVESNTNAIESNKAEVAKLTERADGQDSEMERLTARVRALEKGGPKTKDSHTRAILSESYLKARRSIRLWPVHGSNEEEMWGGVGEFLHEKLAIPEGDIGQTDVEAVTRVCGPLQSSGLVGPPDEVTVTFKDRGTRDMVMGSSVNLATCVDSAGRPTAGTRLEIPDDLRDTFRLLSRFGTRLRARHGEGTKRHIKFDDFAGSLYANIKLPGDAAWTRVSPDMARRDLEASVSEENAAAQKRMAAKLIPGPRERLLRPMTERGVPAIGSTLATSTSLAIATPAPQGKRPRWSGPSRRPL